MRQAMAVLHIYTGADKPLRSRYLRQSYSWVMPCAPRFLARRIRAGCSLLPEFLFWRVSAARVVALLPSFFLARSSRAGCSLLPCFFGAFQPRGS